MTVISFGLLGAGPMQQAVSPANESFTRLNTLICLHRVLRTARSSVENPGVKFVTRIIPHSLVPEHGVGVLS